MVAATEKGEFVHEVAEGGFRRGQAFVGLCGKCLLRDGKFVAKKANLIVFGFEVVVHLIGEDKVQQEKTRTDELG